MELVSPNTPRQKVIVVMPAYNAAKTLRITYDAMPMENVDHVILVDDGSHDETLKIAKELKLEVFVHARNFGYGANQKTCYTEALKAGADIVVMLHPDYQYDPTLLPKVIAPIKAGNADVVLGLDLAEYHTGYRAYSRQVLEAVPFLLNSDNFVFDQEFIVQAAHMGFRIEEVPVPTRYFAEASSVGFWASVNYGFSILFLLGRYLLHRLSLVDQKQFECFAERYRRVE